MRVMYRTYDGLSIDEVKSITLETGDNQIGITGLLLYPEDEDYAIYVKLEDTYDAVEYLRSALRAGYVDLSSCYSIMSNTEDVWCIDEEDVIAFNEWTGCNYQRKSNDDYTSVDKTLLDAVADMV